MAKKRGGKRAGSGRPRLYQGGLAVRITVSLPADVAMALRARAESTGRPLSAIVTEACRRAVAG